MAEIARLRSLLFAPASRPDVLRQAAAQQSRRRWSSTSRTRSPPTPRPRRDRTPTAWAPSSPPRIRHSRSTCASTRCRPSGSPTTSPTGCTPALTGIVVPKIETLGRGRLVERALRDAGLEHLHVVAGMETAAGVDAVREVLRPAGGRVRTSAPRTSSPTWAASAPSREHRGALRPVAGRARGPAGRRPRPRPGRHPVRRRRRASWPTPPVGRSIGYRGKLCIHPAQVPLAHRAFTPSPEEIERARASPGRLRRRRPPGARRRSRSRARWSTSPSPVTPGPCSRLADDVSNRRLRRLRRRMTQHRSEFVESRRGDACGRSSSSWPRRGGSRTPSRRPRPTGAASTPSSPAARSSPTRSCFAEIRAASDSHRAPAPTRCSAGSSTSSTTPSCPSRCRAEQRRAIVELETRVESTFNNFRGEIDGRRVDDNAIAEILRTSDDVAERRAAWDAAKQIGPEVADRHPRARPPAEPGGTRRSATATTSRSRWHTGELDEDRLFATLADVDRATERPFTEWKHELDESLAARFGCADDELRPWHLDDPFFQDAARRRRHRPRLPLRRRRPRGADHAHLRRPRPRPAARCSTHSDLYARDGKSQHAFCIDIDRDGDVRVLCNVEPSERWMDTMLHEFGHAIYDRECDRELPWLVRGAAHALTTEGIAMLVRPAHHATRRGSARSPASRAETIDTSRPRLVDARRAGAPRVRPVGARDDELRAPPLRRSRRRPRHALVGPGGALPAGAPARRPPRAGLGGEDPPRRRARLLPELPLRGAVRVAARRDALPNVPAASSTGTPPASCSCATCSRRARRCGGTTSSIRATGEPLSASTPGARARVLR